MDPDDNTNIIDMRRTFQKFLSGSDVKKRKHDNDGDSFLDTRDFGSETPADSSSLLRGDLLGPSSIKQKSDIIFYKSRVSMLEAQLKHKETELKEQLLLHEQEITSITQQHEREMRAYDAMKTSHARVLHRQELCEQEADELRLTLQRTKDVYDEKLKVYQKRCISVEMENMQAVEEEKARSRELRNQLVQQQADFSIAQSEISQLKELLVQQSRKLTETMSTGVDCEALKSKVLAAESKCKELEAELQQFKDDRLILSVRKKDLTRLDQLTEENKALKSENVYHRNMAGNLELLKEQLASAERKIKRVDDQSQRIADLQIINETQSLQLKEFQEKRVPDDVLRRLKESQEKELLLVADLGQLKSRNRELENKVVDLQDTTGSLQTKLSLVYGQEERLAKQIEHLQRKNLLLTKERDGYQRIIASYESDITREVISPSVDKLQNLQVNLNSYIKANEDLECDLQKSLDEIHTLKRRVLEVEAASKISPHTGVSTADHLDQNLIVELRKNVEELERQLEKMTNEKEILEARIEQRNLAGDFDPTKTKVLHLTCNPATLAQLERTEEVRKLRRENMKLQERIKILEEGGAAVLDLTAQVERKLDDPSALESPRVKELTAKLGSMEQRCERMMEMFKKTSLEFRQVVYQLTGYRIDIVKTHEYKLMSMYAPSPSDFLIFQQSPEGELQLLENEFASTLVELAEEHLQRQHSIPVFLSNLTQDLFKQQTLSVSLA